MISGAGLCWQHVGGVGSTTTTTCQWHYHRTSLDVVSILPRVDCEAIRRGEERACHSTARNEVQFNVVVVDMWDKDWAMALRSSSLIFWLWAACTLVYALASVSEQVVG